MAFNATHVLYNKLQSSLCNDPQFPSVYRLTIPLIKIEYHTIINDFDKYSVTLNAWSFIRLHKRTSMLIAMNILIQ
jgi:hypothetical protein